MSKETYIQVGVTALRSPTGEFLPSVPLYIKVSAPTKGNRLAEPEENLMHDVSGLFAERFEQYMKGK